MLLWRRTVPSHLLNVLAVNTYPNPLVASLFIVQKFITLMFRITSKPYILIVSFQKENQCIVVSDIVIGSVANFRRHMQNMHKSIELMESAQCLVCDKKGKNGSWRRSTPSYAQYGYDH